jgi:hypothetical protein
MPSPPKIQTADLHRNWKNTKPVTNSKNNIVQTLKEIAIRLILSLSSPTHSSKTSKLNFLDFTKKALGRCPSACIQQQRPHQRVIKAKYSQR